MRYWEVVVITHQAVCMNNKIKALKHVTKN